MKRVVELFPEEKKVLEDISIIISYFDMLEMVVEQEDYDTMDMVMEEIKMYQYSEDIQIMIDRLSAQVLNLELENAMIMIGEIKNTL